MGPGRWASRAPTLLLEFEYKMGWMSRLSFCSRRKGVRSEGEKGGAGRLKADDEGGQHNITCPACRPIFHRQ